MEERQMRRNEERWQRRKGKENRERRQVMATPSGWYKQNHIRYGVEIAKCLDCL